MWGLLIVFKRMPHLMKFSHSLNANVSPKRIYNFQNTTILIFTQHLPVLGTILGIRGLMAKGQPLGPCLRSLLSVREMDIKQSHKYYS